MTSQYEATKTKKEAVQEYLTEHPHASNEEVAEALRKQGYDIKKKGVSNVRSHLGLITPKSPENGKSILRPPNELKPRILLEVHRRGGRAEIGESRKPGKDRGLYISVAETVGVTEEERMLTVGDIYPGIFTSGHQNAETEARRNAWDRTMLVAVQQLKDFRFGGPYIQSPQRGVWELTRLGFREVERLTRK